MTGSTRPGSDGPSNPRRRARLGLLGVAAVAVALLALPVLLGRSTAGAAGDPVIVVAGDIACTPSDPNFKAGVGTSTYCHQKYTSDLLSSGLAAVLPVGDIQYQCAGLPEFAGSWTPTWGRFNSLMRPSAGNHEYYSSGGTGCDPTGKAAAYYSYFGAAAGDPAKGYYSYDIGAWHIISLNSNCAAIGGSKTKGCGAGSPQELWLKADLAAHPAACTLAYWHYPKYSSKTPLTDTNVFWQDLYAAGADVIISGHVHNYERFAPQDASGGLAVGRGVRQFVVGSGGVSLESSGTTIAANSEVRARAFGVLKMTLHSNSYDWQFVPDGRNGNTFTDSGSTTCYSAGATDTTPPTAALTAPAAGATVSGATTISADATDDVSVQKVDFLVGGTIVGTDTTAPYSTTWNATTPGPASLTARATDTSGNATTSAARSVTVAAPADTTPPTAALTAPAAGATVSGATTISADATDDVSVQKVDFLVGGTIVGTDTTAPYSTTWNATTPGPASLTARATDTSGNATTSAARSVTVAGTTSGLFSDDFESGTLANWTLVKTAVGGSATVQGALVKTGAFAAQFSETATSGSLAYARETFPADQPTLTVAGDFRVVSEGASGGNVPLLRMFNASGTRILSLYRQNAATDKIYVNAGAAVLTTARLPLGTWGRFSVRVVSTGAGASTVEVSLNGAVVSTTSTATIDPVRTIQIGNDTGAQAFTLVADDISAQP